MAVIYGVISRVIYKHETLSVVTLDWSEITGAYPNSIVRDMRTELGRS